MFSKDHIKIIQTLPHHHPNIIQASRKTLYNHHQYMIQTSPTHSTNITKTLNKHCQPARPVVAVVVLSPFVRPFLAVVRSMSVRLVVYSLIVVRPLLKRCSYQ